MKIRLIKSRNHVKKYVNTTSSVLSTAYADIYPMETTDCKGNH